jgi:hypothetical protein
LIIDQVESLGGYSRTLEEWSISLAEKFQSLIKPELVRMSPKSSDRDIEAFRRMWMVSCLFNLYNGVLTVHSIILPTAKQGLMKAFFAVLPSG